MTIWTEEETVLLKENYDNPKNKLMELFPTRGWNSVNHKVHKLGLYRGHIRYDQRNTEHRRKMSDACSREISIPPLTPDLAYFLGSIAGDGSVSKSDKRKGRRRGFTYQVFFTGRKPYCEKMVELCKNLFGLPAKMRQRERGRCDMWISSKNLHDFLVSLFGNSRSLKWRIPAAIIHGSDEIKSAFLRGLFDTDGSVWVRKNSHGIRLRLRNEEVINHLANMTTTLGLKSRLCVYGKDASFGIYSYQGLRLFKEKIGFSPWALVTKGKDKGMKKTEKLDLALSKEGMHWSEMPH